MPRADILPDPLVSPDGARVVYVADQDTDEVIELYSVSIDGSASPVKLNAPLVAGGDVEAGRFRISPDGSRVVYLADQETDGLSELYSVPIDASAAPAKLSSGRSLGGGITPDGSRVVFLGREDFCDGGYVLYSVPIDGSASAIRLHLPFFPGRTIYAFGISPDGTGVVYHADPDSWGLPELFTVPVDGSAMPVKLNPPLGAQMTSGAVVAFEASPDGNRAVYRANPAGDAVHRLFSVPFDRSTGPIELNGTLVAGGTVDLFHVVPGGRVVFTASRDTPGLFELFSVPADASATAAKLSGSMIPCGDVTGFMTSADGTRVVYVADAETDEIFELYSVPSDGSTPPVKLNGPLVPGGDVGNANDALTEAEVQISPDGTRVVYLADQAVDGVFELYSVPIDGGRAPVRLLDAVPGYGALTPFRITPDGQRVVYSLGNLYSVPIDGADEGRARRAAGAPPERRIRLNGELDRGSIGVFVLGLDGCVVYSASQRFAGSFLQLYSVPNDGSRSPIELAHISIPRARYRTLAVSPDGSRVVYAADAYALEVIQLFSVPIDGSAPAVELNLPLPPGGDVSAFLVSPDSARVVYGADQFADGVSELFSAPIDGSSPAVRLNGTLAPSDDVWFAGTAISPDGRWVAYRAGPGSAGNELYRVSILGRSAPVRLNGQLAAPGYLSAPLITSDGRVLYSANEARGGPGLYATLFAHALPADDRGP